MEAIRRKITTVFMLFVLSALLLTVSIVVLFVVAILQGSWLSAILLGCCAGFLVGYTAGKRQGEQ